MEQGQTLLHATPLRELTIEIDEKYVAQCTGYLQSYGCTITCQSAGRYTIDFPEGTMEETYLGKSGLYTSETTIRLKSGETFRKITASPLNETQQTRTTMAFPAWVLDGCKPQKAIGESVREPDNARGTLTSLHWPDNCRDGAPTDAC